MIHLLDSSWRSIHLGRCLCKQIRIQITAHKQCCLPGRLEAVTAQWWMRQVGVELGGVAAGAAVNQQQETEPVKVLVNNVHSLKATQMGDHKQMEGHMKVAYTGCCYLGLYTTECHNYC